MLKISIEADKFSRINEPITGSIPFEKGKLFSAKDLSLWKQNSSIPLQTEILAKWPDNSIKWLLCKFSTDVKAGKPLNLTLKKKSAKIKNRLSIIKTHKGYIIDTNLKKHFLPFDKLGLFDDLILKKAKTNATNKHKFICNKCIIEEFGPISGTIKYTGTCSNMLITVRYHFFSMNHNVKIDITTRNPNSSSHLGGFWDLGDPNSILFKDLSIITKENGKAKLTLANKTTAHNTISIYQDSSGEENWQSKSHVNKNNKIKNTIKGFVATLDNTGKTGNKAQPTITINNKSFALKHFHQNCPKAIRYNNSQLSFGLFPQEYQDLHELQPGEQKTHTLYINFNGEDLSWINTLSLLSCNPEIYCSTAEIINNLDPRYIKLIDNVIKGKHSFKEKNKIIDEYGWRNFGDIYADHEAQGNPGLISHYNNQYDVINGLLLQFFRTSNKEYYKLADNMAKHVADIDIYHTEKDKAAYNGGMFWHTFHYMDAATSTHRSYSKRGITIMDKFEYGIGGGPGHEHCYATGLLNHYFLTGSQLSKEAVLSLANWIINSDDGRKSPLKLLNSNRTGKPTMSGSIYYHGPGRGSGNSINTLIDAFELTNKKSYIKKAEEFIRRCIHPYDHINKINLHDIEHRWFYLVFLQALCRYIDLKRQMNELDTMFHYATASLLNYAKWMLKNEKPYSESLDKVDIPSETWPAQDIRKSIILDNAYLYSGDEQFKDKANYFFNRCIDDLNKFGTKTYTRPLAIIMSFSLKHEYLKKIKPYNIKINKQNFGKPKCFKPQGYYIYKSRDLIKKILSRH